MPLPGGSSKAKFISLDDGVMFEVQYNPKDFKVNKAMTWEESSTQGDDANTLQFQKGAPMTASFELMFDTTADGNQNVQSTWVNSLLALTNAEVKPGKGEAKELDKKRPRALMFQWGGFVMDCVIESVNVTYLMFSSSGDAVRASCQVQLKEWTKPKAFVPGGGTGSNEVASEGLVVARGGETIAQIAASVGVDVRALARANGISDPLADCTGKTLKVPRVSASVSANERGGRASVSAAGIGSASTSWGRGGGRR